MRLQGQSVNNPMFYYEVGVAVAEDKHSHSQFPIYRHWYPLAQGHIAAVPVQAAGRALVVYEVGIVVLVVVVVVLVVVVVRCTVTVAVLCWRVTVVVMVATHELASAAGRMARC